MFRHKYLYPVLRVGCKVNCFSHFDYLMCSNPKLEHFSTSITSIVWFGSSLSANVGEIQVCLPFVLRLIVFPGFFLLCFVTHLGGIICWYPLIFLISSASSFHFLFCASPQGSLLPCCFLFKGFFTTLNNTSIYYDCMSF